MADADTTSKRRSVVQLLKPAWSAPPAPDGVEDGGDRQHIALMYSGISAQVVRVEYPGQQSWGGTISLYGLGGQRGRRGVRQPNVRVALAGKLPKQPTVRTAFEGNVNSPATTKGNFETRGGNG